GLATRRGLVGAPERPERGTSGLCCWQDSSHFRPNCPDRLIRALAEGSVAVIHGDSLQATAAAGVSRVREGTLRHRATLGFRVIPLRGRQAQSSMSRGNADSSKPIAVEDA